MLWPTGIFHKNKAARDKSACPQIESLGIGCTSRRRPIHWVGRFVTTLSAVYGALQSGSAAGSKISGWPGPG
jgi:hypothetical protein